ncbi:unnamed protein product [Rotaria magnacalcarata]|uniref:B box-type domain-containing protein n=1 Tax=Rotaria magnacalcarata TaxID=392030 RepID=A0A816TZW0_9BILA|nr:unnamed protein product [Rotaria magnacalcarata]CAF2107615.1 unnamed protein product [Rotaria magnacalcarata]CAF4309585.1 unnamed protein product [Rotaria magnacalcarata]CAF4399298.1 unnamed protein product [Rotaria magnacalcarata]
MESDATRKHCASNDACKQTATAICEGCSQAFCTKHFNAHRLFLGDEIDAVISEYDQVHHIFNEQKTNTDAHPLMKQISDWEKESIAKIQQKARELRQELIQKNTIHLDRLSKKLQDLSEQLKQGREHDSFVEADIGNWKKSLGGLKKQLVLKSILRINQDSGNPLVQNVFVNSIENDEVFDRVFDNSARIEENGLAVIHTSNASYTDVRGRNEYSSGCHRIHLCIQQSSDTWLFLGVKAKSAPLQETSYSSKSTYGWSSNNYSWLNGQAKSNQLPARIEMKTNDTIILIFDCDNRKISMTNERTTVKFDLVVNLNDCPFPWQLHVILHEANSHVRILS